MLKPFAAFLLENKKTGAWHAMHLFSPNVRRAFLPFTKWSTGIRARTKSLRSAHAHVAKAAHHHAVLPDVCHGALTPSTGNF